MTVVAALLLAALATMFFDSDDAAPPSNIVGERKVSQLDQTPPQARQAVLPHSSPETERESDVSPKRLPPGDSVESELNFDAVELTRARMTVLAYAQNTAGIGEVVKEMSDQEVMEVWRAIRPTHLVRKDVKSQIFDAIYEKRDSLPDSEKKKRVREWPKLDPDDFLVIRKVKDGKRYATVIDTRDIEGYSTMTANLASLDSDLTKMVAQRVRSMR